MITNLEDLDAALGWMRRNGYRKAEPEDWHRCVPYGGFEIVCAGVRAPWMIHAIHETNQPPHGYPWAQDRDVAPWVVEQILALTASARSDRR
jgi:hypothetical protein